MLTFLGKLRVSRFGNLRAAGALWVSFVLVISAVGIQTRDAEDAREEAEMAALRESSPAQYLARIREDRGEDVWLGELERLDPDAFRREIEARERVVAEAQANAAESERVPEPQGGPVGDRAPQGPFQAMDWAESDIGRPVTLPTRTADVSDFLDRVDAYSELVHRLERYAIDSELRERLGRFRVELVEFQRREFPRVRDALGPAMRRGLWIDNASARTIGEGYRTIEITSFRYVLNVNIQRDYETVQESLRRLRFTRAVFRQPEGGSGARYNVGRFAPADDEIVVWRNGFALEVEAPTERVQSPSFEASRPGILGTWTADCGVPCEISIEVATSGDVDTVWRFSDGSTGRRPLGTPTISDGAYHFRFTDQTGLDLGEHLIVRPSGELSVFDRLGLTMTGEVVDEVDFELFE
ncbi:MAG: hypothetical protein JJU18_05685 [Oceanicaulis sp.]|nr:hypothetical protein [Oceanicaulis sp.]